MAHIGYVRNGSGNACSGDGFSGCRANGVALDKLFEDAGGGIASRPGLHECLGYLKSGDILHVPGFVHLAQNAIDLQSLVAGCVNKGVTVRFHKENLTFSPDADETLHMLEIFAEFEKSARMERQRQGRVKAREMGKTFGRPVKITPELKKIVLARLQTGEPAVEVAKDTGLSRSSVYGIRRNSRM
jgi:DNA invertase Pin-like site-specific DNA recombinase